RRHTVDGWLVRRWRLILGLDGRRQPRTDVLASPTLAQEVSRAVQRDFRQPRPNRIARTRRRVRHGGDERVLHDVFGIGRAAEHAIAERPEKAPVLLVLPRDAGARDVRHATSAAIVALLRPR